MIEISLRKSIIFGVLTRIADENYQRLAWFNSHAEVSSPDELINQLLDDYQFEQFIVSPEVRLSARGRDDARAFFKQLKTFCDQTPQTLDARETIDDPRWNQVRQGARSILWIFAGSELD